MPPSGSGRKCDVGEKGKDDNNNNDNNNNEQRHRTLHEDDPDALMKGPG
jgi:hypothetical protein